MIDYSLLKFSKGTPRSVERLARRRTVKAAERKVRDKVNVRDGHTCFWPRCHELAFHKHHQVYRSRGGKWATDNIVSGCGLHHRWVHDQLIRLIGNPDKPPLEIELTTLGRQARIRIPKQQAA